MSSPKWIAAAVVVAGAAAWPFAVGQIAKQQIETNVVQTVSQGVSVTLNDYQAGYLTSSFSTTYQIDDPGLVALFEEQQWRLQWVVRHQVSHGLTGVTMESTVEDLSWPLLATSDIELNGDAKVHVALQQHQFSDDDMQVEIAASDLYAQVHGDEVTFQLNAPTVVMTGENNVRLSFNNITSEGDINGASRLGLGAQNFHIDTIRSENAPDGDLNIADVDISAALTEHNGRLDYQFDMSLAKIEFPGAPAGSMAMTWLLKDVDSVSVLTLSEKLEQADAESQFMTDTDAMQALDTLLARGFSFSISKLSLNVMNQQFDGNLVLTIPEGTSGVLQNPQLLVAALQGKLDADYRGDLMGNAQLRQQLEGAVSAELLQQTPNGYQLGVSLQQGELTFAGGKKMPLLQLLAPFTQS